MLREEDKWGADSPPTDQSYKKKEKAKKKRKVEEEKEWCGKIQRGRRLCVERSRIERLLDQFVGGEEQKRNERKEREKRKEGRKEGRKERKEERKERERRRREEEGNRTSVLQWLDPDRLGMELRYER